MAHIVTLFLASQFLLISHVALAADKTCKYDRVQKDDGCWAMADRCGISVSDIKKYNPNPKFCDPGNLKVGQYYCCSSGSLPDFTPKPNPDGTCTTHVVAKDETCDSIAAANSLTADKLKKYNDKTWGWQGCKLQLNQVICLSTGEPPMPLEDPKVTCGPTKPGTKRPKDMSTLDSLNPCPLKACCNKWGHCGTTEDFCKSSKSETGNPGTTWCISNCGMKIVNNSKKPAHFRRVGYFEAWNYERECLVMDATQLDSDEYDTVHFAFATITTDFEVDIGPVEVQFKRFLKQPGIHKILSFGGWSFSTDLDTFPIFGQSVSDTNRERFANNVVNFMEKHGLDGVDFDWEYPAAPDIPGIGVRPLIEGVRYLEFLKIIRKKMGSKKTLSIAAPASYWYLRGFPIAEMSKVVDYIIYMTYDLHGQWDFETKYGAEECPGGSCLRSHVNSTETMNALTMITKAGVEASKVIVGIASYGRSFQMVNPSCTGPNCKFTKAGSKPGVCTNTSSYISNAELADILRLDKKAKVIHDKESDSKIMTYGGDQWVAYMDDGIRKSRVATYIDNNMGGISDWAVDLLKFRTPVEIDGHVFWEKGGHSPGGLSADADCNDLKAFQGDTDNDLRSWMWDMVDATKVFQGFVDDFSGDTFTADFADPLGLGESYSSIPINDVMSCGNCDFNAEDAAANYMILTSICHLNRILQILYLGLKEGAAAFAGKSAWYQSTFNKLPRGSSKSTLIMQEIVQGVGTGAAVTLALSGTVVTGALGALIGGLAGIVSTAIVSDDGDAIADLGRFEKAVATAVDNAKQKVDNQFQDLNMFGRYSTPKSKNLVDLFRHGAFADLENIPVLRQGGESKAVNAMRKHVASVAVNWAWRTQHTWIVSYPMTQQEFDDKEKPIYAGNNEPRLKLYQKGRGYFFLSIWPESNAGGSLPRIQNPPGWGEIQYDDGGLGVHPHQVIKSSIETFNSRGFKATNPLNYTNIITNPTADFTKDSVALAGVFTIPVCNLDSSYGWTKTVETFKNSLAGPGAWRDRNDKGWYPPICYCVGVKDKYGATFDEAMDLDNWSGGRERLMCNEGFYNTPGGDENPADPRTHGPRDSVPVDQPGQGLRAAKAPHDEL